MLAPAVCLTLCLAATMPSGPQSPTATPPQPAPQDPAPAADNASIDAVVTALYATISGPAGQKRDWARMRALFHENGRMVAMTPRRGGGMQTTLLTVDDYVKRAGPRLEQDGFFEQEIARRTETFGDLAHVFSTYEARKALADEKPMMRGINSIQLVRTDGRWSVLQILWEQEHDAGPIPAEFLASATAPAAAPATVAAPTTEPTKDLPPFDLRIVGSDSLLAVAIGWAKAYAPVERKARIVASGGGTGAGFAAFARGEVEIAMAMRRLAADELAAARASGTEPVEVCFARSPIVVCVHADNPLPALSLDQLRDLWTEGGPTTHWSQLSVTMPAGAADEVALAGRSRDTAIDAAFRTLVAKDGKLRVAAHALAGDRDVLELVAHERSAIGYAGTLQPPAGIRLVPIVAADGRAVAPSAASIRDGTYPLARPCYLYYRDEPTGRVKAFVRWLQAEGRATCEDQGLVPTGG